MGKLHRGFTLIELMIVVAIIGILASIALPAYQDYIARSQVSEAVYLVQAGKTPFVDYYADKGIWPATSSDVMGTTNGKYVSSITITLGAGTTGTLQLTAHMKDTDVNTFITQGTLILQSTDSGKSWDCTGGNIATKYRPASCRN